MTQKEALQLQTVCEQKLRENHPYKMEMELSMALTGRLRIATDSGWVNMRYPTMELDWIKWNGTYTDLMELVEYLRTTIPKFTGHFDKLMWSYNNQTLLTEDE